MTDTDIGLLDVVLVAFVIGIALLIHSLTPKAPVLVPVVATRAFAWRWCPNGCMKKLTDDPLASCVVCQRPLEARP